MIFLPQRVARSRKPMIYLPLLLSGFGQKRLDGSPCQKRISKPKFKRRARKSAREKTHLPYKAVVDTNILVSAMLSPGKNAARIMDMIRDGLLVPCYNAEILEEYQEVLGRGKFNFSRKNADAILSGIALKGLLVNHPESSFGLPDEDDRKFYDAAKSAAAFLITGNTKHYPEEPRIVSPARFLEITKRE